MLEDISTSGAAYKALRLAIEKLNSTLHFTDKGNGLEYYVEMKIIKSCLQRELYLK